MPVASWIALAIAGCIPVAMVVERRAMGSNGLKSWGLLTGATIITGLIGIFG